MRTIDIGIRHEDDLVIAETVDIELVTNTYTEALDKGDQLGVSEHLIETSALSI